VGEQRDGILVIHDRQNQRQTGERLKREKVLLGHVIGEWGERTVKRAEVAEVGDVAEDRG